MERIIEARRRLREEAIRKARIFTECIKNKLGRITAIVFGSYARGDFNIWSDIDILIIADAALPKNPLKRLDIVEECLLTTGEIEPVILTIGEFMEKLHKRDPAVIEAIERGIIVLDELELRKLIESPKTCAGISKQ